MFVFPGSGSISIEQKRTDVGNSPEGINSERKAINPRWGIFLVCVLFYSMDINSLSEIMIPPFRPLIILRLLMFKIDALSALTVSKLNHREHRGCNPLSPSLIFAPAHPRAFVFEIKAATTFLLRASASLRLNF